MKKTTTAYDVQAEDYLQLLSTLIRLDLYGNKGRTSINKCLIITIHLVNAGSPEDLNSQLHYESHCLLMFTVTWEIELFSHCLACSTDRRVNSTLSYSIHFLFVCLFQCWLYDTVHRPVFIISTTRTRRPTKWGFIRLPVCVMWIESSVFNPAVYMGWRKKRCNVCIILSHYSTLLKVFAAMQQKHQHNCEITDIIKTTG